MDQETLALLLCNRQQIINMMKSFISYVAYALAVIITAGCVKVDIQYVPQDNTTATLLLKSMDLSKTRVSEEDADLLKSQGALNENYIDHIQCFFLDSEMNVTYMTDVIAVEMPDTGEGVSAPVTIPSDIMKTLFSNGSCDLYVLANASEIKAKPADLNSLELNTIISLSTDSTVPQQSFVMVGVAEDVKEENNVIEGEVYLERVASKIEIGLNIKKEISVGTTNPETWVPDTTRIKITYNNSVITSNLSATSINEGSLMALVQEHNTKDGNTDKRIKFDEDNESESYRTGNLKVPFYSYPNEWNSVTDDNAASIILEIPWKKKDAQNYMTYRYQIPVNFDNMEILRNHIYKLDITVGILGALTGTVELTPSYIVTDWQTLEINTSLSRPRYLVVDENKVVMNNVNSYSVGYSSSDPVEALITSITKPNYSEEEISTTTIYPTSNNHNGTESIAPTVGNTSLFSVSVVPGEDGNGQIVLSHTLNNDNTNAGYDYVPYSITVEVTNSIGYKEYIEYTQYPAMYIEAQKNSGQPNNKDRGYVIIYGSTNSSSNWQAIVNLSSGGNHNPNMYVITTTALDKNSTFVLGDSRSDSVVTGESLGLTSSYNEKNLANYYPSRTDNEDYVAPKFRIASSYGKCSGTVSHSEAIKRCAAYQEDGYSAGRWRVPTTAEMIYIAQISRKGWIPHLFSDGKNYWSATERITYSTTTDPNGNNSTDGNAYIRCVYDEWYWGSSQLTDKSKFTWGDKARN